MVVVENENLEIHQPRADVSIGPIPDDDPLNRFAHGHAPIPVQQLARYRLNLPPERVDGGWMADLRKAYAFSVTSWRPLVLRTARI